MRITVCLCILVLSNCRSADRSVEEKQGKLGTQGPSTAPAIEADPKEGETPVVDSPAVFMQVQPGDMMSHVDETPIHITLVTSDGRISQSLIDSIIAGTSLNEWPTQKAMPFKTSVISTEAGYGPGGGKILATAEITIKADADLNRDVWYAVVVKNLDKKSVAVSERSHLLAPNGDVIARFVKNAKPTLAGVRICPKTDFDIVSVDFSERIAVGAAQKGSLRLKRGLANCDAVTGDPTQDSAENMAFKCTRAQGERGVQDVSVSMQNIVDGSQRAVGILASVGQGFAGDVAFPADSFLRTGDGCAISKVR